MQNDLDHMSPNILFTFLYSNFLLYKYNTIPVS